MLFGDDFGDFLPDVKKNISYQERAALVTKHMTRWGTQWYALPNPTYGSWNGVLSSPKKDNLRGYE
jgi:acid phosphatase